MIRGRPGRRRPGPLVAAAVAAGAVVAAAARRLLLHVTVEGDSMQPALGDGDHVLAVRTPPAPIRRGTLVVGRTPETSPGFVRFGEGADAVELEPVHRPVFVKRVVGLPGDEVTPRNTPAGAAGGTVLVPPGHVFVEGEAAYSQDSGLWGPVPRERILGLAVTRLRRGPGRP